MSKQGSEEHRHKISLALKGRPSPLKGVKQKPRGKYPPWSEERKKKQSVAKRGQVPWNKGIPHTEETLRKILEGNKRALERRKNEGLQRHDYTKPRLEETS